MKSAKHKSDHGDVDEGLTVVRPLFIVAAEAAAFHEPAKGPLNDPALGQDLESSLVLGSVNDFQLDSTTGTQEPQPVDQLAGISAIGPDDFQAGETGFQEAQQEARTVPILDGGWRDDDREDQAQRVDQQMAFAARQFFPRVETACARLVGDFDRLAINDSGRRIGFSSQGDAQGNDQNLVNPLPNFFFSPLTEVVVNRWPRRKIVRQLSPLATGFDDINNGVHDSSAWMDERSPESFKAWDHRLDLFPLGIGQIGWIKKGVLHPHLESENRSDRNYFPGKSEKLLSKHALRVFIEQLFQGCDDLGLLTMAELME
jgi:hypothetical protein